MVLTIDIIVETGESASHTDNMVEAADPVSSSQVLLSVAAAVVVFVVGCERDHRL